MSERKLEPGVSWKQLLCYNATEGSARCLYYNVFETDKVLRRPTKAQRNYDNTRNEYDSVDSRYGAPRMRPTLNRTVLYFATPPVTTLYRTDGSE